jgi:hypothetical protein
MENPVTRINHAINSLVGRISADVQRAERQPDNENARNDQPRPRHPGRQAILNRPERTNECLYIGVNGRNLAAMVIEDRLQQAAL